jgi:replication factor A1
LLRARKFHGQNGFWLQRAYILKVAYHNVCRDSSRKKSKLIVPVPRIGVLFQDNSDTSTWKRTHLNCKKPVLSDHLAFLSVKHGVYLSELFDAIVEARRTGEATCEELKIEYRGSVAGEAILLITKSGKVVVQFRAAEEFLLRKNINFESWMHTEQIYRQIARQGNALAGSGAPRPIQDLRHGMKKVHVEAEITETSKPVLVHTQYGNNVLLTNASIADNSGKIRLCLWNEQADFVKVGDSVRIDGASVTSFKGERQLRLGKKGTITVIQNGIPQANRTTAESPRNLLFA